VGAHPGPGGAPLTLASSWGSEELGDQETDVLARYGPPFDLASDLLFALALAPTAPLRCTFPGVPFLTLFGRTPLLVWFGRVRVGCYETPGGQRRCDGGPESVLYHELNVLALLRHPALFVPGIYATSARSIRIGRRYGMPKRATTMSFQVAAGRVRSGALVGARRSSVEARLLGSGRGLARLLTPWWPRHVWPVRFPSGSRVSAVVQATPRVQLAHIVRGQLALEAAWLPDALPLLPVGLYLPDLRMQLPPP
jgi:hypothetical protein